MKKPTLLTAVCACLSFITFNVSAAIVTQGYLSTNDDGSSNIITDSLNNVEYLRLDVLADSTYAQTVAVLGTQDGGGWSIASPTDALAFTAALLGGTTSCAHNGADVTVINCGIATGWYGGKMGDNYKLGTDGFDYAWFLDSAGAADYIVLTSGGGVGLEDYGLLGLSDDFAAGGASESTPIAWLVTRPAEVPIPPAVWLFGTGLLGLFGVARRKEQ